MSAFLISAGIAVHAPQPFNLPPAITAVHPTDMTHHTLFKSLHKAASEHAVGS
jgi:hypothetical protein